MQSKCKRLRDLVLNVFRVGQDIYCGWQCMALDSFHAQIQIQISNSKCDMGHFPIFNKTWLSCTGEADICCYNSGPNTVPGRLVTSFNRAKCWETSLLNSAIFSFKLQQESSGPPLYLCLIDRGLIWAWCRYSEFLITCQGAATRCHRGADQSEWKCVGVFVVCLSTNLGAVYFMSSWREAKRHVSVLLQLSLRSRSFFLNHVLSSDWMLIDNKGYRAQINTPFHL